MKLFLLILTISVPFLASYELSSPLTKAMRNNTLSTIYEWEHKNKLVPLHTPTEQANPLTKINRSYRIPSKCELSEAQKIIVQYTKGLLESINSNCEIRPNLSLYPFTAGQMTIYIRLIDEDTNTFAKLPFVAMVVLDKDKITYVGSKNDDSPLFNINSETYEEACALAQKD